MHRSFLTKIVAPATKAAKCPEKDNNSLCCIARSSGGRRRTCGNNAEESGKQR